MLWFSYVTQWSQSRFKVERNCVGCDFVSNQPTHCFGSVFTPKMEENSVEQHPNDGFEQSLHHHWERISMFPYLLHFGNPKTYVEVSFLCVCL